MFNSEIRVPFLHTFLLFEYLQAVITMLIKKLQHLLLYKRQSIHSTGLTPE